MASQELASRPTCDSTLQMRYFSHKFQTLVIHKGSITRWVRGWFTPATELKRLKNCRFHTKLISECKVETDLTNNSDHPHQHVCETWDPDGWHEEGYHEPFFPEPSPTVRDGQEKQSDDGQRQNPEDPFQVTLWHSKHTFMLCWDASRQTRWWADL